MFEDTGCRNPARAAAIEDELELLRDRISVLEDEYELLFDPDAYYGPETVWEAV